MPPTPPLLELKLPLKLKPKLTLSPIEEDIGVGVATGVEVEVVETKDQESYCVIGVEAMYLMRKLDIEFQNVNFTENTSKLVLETGVNR